VNLFRAFVVAIFIAIATYTGVVAVHHGVDLFTVFFGDMAKLSWSGQFNLDFTCLLALSGIWVAYRHRFRPVGLALGGCAFVGGALFLSVYLLAATARAKGDAKALLLGENAKAA